MRGRVGRARLGPLERRQIPCSTQELNHSFSDVRAWHSYCTESAILSHVLIIIWDHTGTCMCHCSMCMWKCLLLFSWYLCACVNGEIGAHRNMNSKMTVTFPVNRTGFFALQFSIGLLTQVSIIFVFLGVLPFSLPAIWLLLWLSHCHCNCCSTVCISKYDKRTDFKWE